MQRRIVFDVLKGIGILEVITHHALGQAGRKFSSAGSAEWWTLRLVNRTLHFAIPLFLLVSATLLAQSLLKRPDWGRFVQRRVARTFWPYLLWSAVYLVFRWKVLRTTGDTWIARYDYPILGTLRGPEIFVDLNEIGRELFWGKAYFHLYFMVVLLQLAVLLPLVIAVSRRLAFGFDRTVLLAVGSQLVVYLLQRYVLHVATPGSMAIWYLPSLVLGVWVGMDMERWRALWPRLRRPLLIALAASYALYLGLSVATERGVFIDSIVSNSSFSLYTAVAALLFLGLAPSLAATKTGSFLAVFGRVSLPMFLVHPLVLYAIGGPRFTAAFARLPVPVLGTIVLTTALSYAFSRLVMAIRLDPLLFGQRLPQPSDRATATASERPATT